MIMECQRSYEDPRTLENELEELNKRIESENDESTLVDLYIERNELEERINFAWQDNEYEMEGRYEL